MHSPKQPARIAMLLLLALLMLCDGVSNVNCSTVHENSVDLHALLDFHRGITNDPQGAMSNWRNTTHFCRWNGVNCTTTRPFRVSSLNLTSQKLQGQISSSVGNLTFLQLLDLSNNSFVGTIPLLNHLQQLWYLSVSDNLLHGNFPDSLTNSSNLAILDLSRNHLTGAIPPRIGNLTKLYGFSLFRNNFTGFIPAALGTITTLTQLDLSENQLSGQIPNELWQMSNMVILALSTNSLTGGFPQILPNISSFQSLTLTANMLSGALPSNIGDSLPSLQFLELGRNTFNGHIPASLGNASGLTEIDLPFNYFTGKIPNSFGKLPLSSLNLGHNKLEARDSESWEFFDALANCSDLDVLSLSNNQLEGVIPNSIGNLPINLQYLLMGGNKLSGIVPPSIGKFHNLIELTLDRNNLTGTIEWVGKLRSLQHLNLGVNKFIGTIPPSIRNLTKLTFLSLSENDFTGSMPSSLGILQQMLNLNFSYNKLQGIIPMEFGNLKQLTALDLSSNKFSGQIPETLGNCEQLLTIRIDQNILIGNIPITFSNLNSLTLLNLSHNNLSGQLPDRGVNDLKLLTTLDLSYNHFQGEIPISGIFDNATVVLLDGNLYLCGGTKELHMPPCHVVSRRTRTANYWVKILIPIFGIMSLILLVYLLLSVKKTSRRSDINLQTSFGDNFVKVTYKDLAQATRDFSELNLIGRGSYGSVYRGKLKESKMEMAVKVFNLEMRGAERSFMAECEALRSIQHRNLLPIVTACSTVDNVGSIFKALVYEFMPNGNLDMWIHHKGGKEATNRLGLIQRISIVVNIADALDYLHHDCGRPTVHCDLKPSNILLDEDMNALLGDFGIARFYVNPEATWAGSTTSVGVKGTIGYIPPEYGRGGHTSTSGDVYSFGIVLLEVLTSKRPTDPMFADGLDMINFVENSFPYQIYHIIDAHLVEQCKNLAQEKMVSDNEIYQCLSALLQVALCCTRSLTSERLNMKQVATKMHAIKTSLLGWTDKEHSY